jgi:hypothetical protein
MAIAAAYIGQSIAIFRAIRIAERTNEVLTEFRMKDLQKRIAELTKDEDTP